MVMDGYVADVLAIVPDVDRDFLQKRITELLPEYGDKVVEPVIHALLDAPYPQATTGTNLNGKRQRSEDTDESSLRANPRRKIQDNYSRTDRIAPSKRYVEVSLNQLLLDFPLIPKPYIRDQFTGHNSLYAPSFLYLHKEQTSGTPLPYKLKTRPFTPKYKGKGKVLTDEQFEAELVWIQHREIVPTEVEVTNNTEAANNNDRLEHECGCCFSTDNLSNMISCPDGHLFCASCIHTYTSTLLGENNAKVFCMDQAGCTLPFTASELSRALDDKLLDLWFRVKLAKELEMAEIDGLEQCPFCEYRVVIENEAEKLFRCENEECGMFSCRACKKLDHLPRRCQEIEEDRLLDGRHSVEEAMTKALMRNCPKCDKGFVKDGGCNKMTCPSCGTYSCYVCRQEIEGYYHFQTSSKCNISTEIADILAEQIKAAADKAVEDFKLSHPDVDRAQLEGHLLIHPPGRK